MPSPNYFSYGDVKLLDVPHARALANEIFEEDCYDFARVPTGAVVLDVGACYGEFAIRCAVEKQCHVIAYEPSRANREVLEANKRLNGLSDDQLRISPCAVVGSVGKRIFMHRADHPAGSLLDVEAQKHGCVGETYEVDCTGLQQQVQVAHALWGRWSPIVLKLDCEGAEHEIFEDYPKWIDAISMLALEWHNYDGDVFRKIIAPQGFNVHVEGGGPKPRPAWDPTIGAGLLIAVRG